MTRFKAAVVVFLLASAIALGACGDNGNGDGAPDAVIEAVREVEPRISTVDIDADYVFMKEQVPDATDEDIARWIVEMIAYNDHVEEWNDCLEGSPTGAGCTEPDEATISDDNPRGW